MAKRTIDEPDDSDIDVSSTDSEHESNMEDEQEIVNVDFDYFDLNPDVDFQAFKTFLQQLLGDDYTKFDLSSISDLILKESSVGSTIKTDGKESDPFAILTVLNLNENILKPCIKSLMDYFLKKTSSNIEFNLFLRKLIYPENKAAPKKLGFVFSERMINMPVEVVPPMYKMLLDEMNKTEDANEKYEFDYFLVPSKVYKLVAAKVKEETTETKPKKKKISTRDPTPVELDYFHYEDLILEENARFCGRYDYDNVGQDSDSRRVFTEYGISPMLSLILIDKDSLAKSVPQMEEKFPPF